MDLVFRKEGETMKEPDYPNVIGKIEHSLVTISRTEYDKLVSDSDKLRKVLSSPPSSKPKREYRAGKEDGVLYSTPSKRD